MASVYTLYDYLPSGNGYKCRLVLNLLRLPYRLVEVDIVAGGSRTPAFLAKNPNGRIPLLEEAGADGQPRYLSESHAIIQYLAEGSALLPADAWDRAKVQQWLAFEQYHLEPNIGTARFWLHSKHLTPEELGDKYTQKLADGHAGLRVLEQGLAGQRYLVGNALSLADIACYAYTHVAEEGGFDLAPYPAVRAWHDQLASLEGWVPITEP